MSNEVNVRGYIVSKSSAYLRSIVSEAEARRIWEGFSPALNHAISQAKPAEWMPAAYSSEILRAIVAQSKGNEDHARDELIKCGRYIANEATNTFLRLLMRVLTPALFAKKLPGFWSRDSTAGRYEVDVTEDKITCHLKEMEAFEHIAPIGMGYVSFALEAMGKKITKTQLHGWSLSRTTAADGIWFELFWER
ncbi:MAG TPA: hypothetical protein VM734_11605 [Kofleriaceae bacterium]|jgi:hypothetical protein|nr:hypothetical protein [Kofleriaceae bacterium]